MVRIVDIATTIVSIPVRHRVVSAVRNDKHIIDILIELETDADIRGVSYIAAFTRHKARAICALIDDFAAAIAGMDANCIGMVWDQAWQASRLAGHSGLAAFALSAIDTALWDLQGKLLNVPLHRLLGTRRLDVPAYASDGCWLYPEAAQVVREAVEFVEAGFKSVKIRFGRADPEQDIAVLAAVRQAVGSAVGVMVDANQAWTQSQAEKYGRRLAEFDITWLEEPLPAEDVSGLADLRQRLEVPVVAGENAYLPAGIKALLDAGAVSLVMPDLQRVGGISGWSRATALAEAYHVPVTAHLFPEVSIHLLASATTIGPLEWVSWAEPILEEPLRIENGMARVPQSPGLGITFRKDAVARYRLV